jgi:hypothetical protein
MSFFIILYEMKLKIEKLSCVRRDQCFTELWCINQKTILNLGSCLSAK